MGKNQKRIAVLAPFGRLYHQAGILNAITCFAESGYTIEVFTLRNLNYHPPEFKSKNVNIHYLPISFESHRESPIWATVLFMAWLPFVLRGQYLAVFAAGVRSLFAAWFMSWFRNVRIINYQMELYIGAKLNIPFKRIFKWLEGRAIRACFITLEHDENRAQILCKDAGISRRSIELLPNAPRGTGKVQRSRFLHDKLGIKENTHLLVTAGSLSPTFLSEETVVAAQNLPESWICVLHSAQPRSDNDNYIYRLRFANSQGKVVFSLDPLPYNMVDKVLSSADIGLALYGEIGGMNTTEVGLASGKLCHFLQFGVPVIVSDFPVLREFVMRHRVGVPLYDLNDLPQAISTIMDDYEGYCERAAATFTSELAFQIHFQRVLDRLDIIRQ